MKHKIATNLPGYNCGVCGFASCHLFAEALTQNRSLLNKCAVLDREQYKSQRQIIEALLVNEVEEAQTCGEIFGVIDNYVADIILTPLNGESSCREVLMPTSMVSLKVDDLIEYRPLGCPIVHFAKIIKTDGLLITVHIIGPCKARILEGESIKIGCCMVIGFEGRYSGKSISVGETIRFLPHHCMMQKVHSGVVVSIEDDRVLIEGIDLKVWQVPQRK